MESKKKAEPAPVGNTTHIENCSVTNGAQVNADTRLAIEALANASKAHAEALQAMARSLQGGESHMGNAFNFNN
jgi:ferric-dicitrate binding protein FerR (iron transport regulator)